MTSAMASTEEDLSAMLQTNHPSQGHMSMSMSNAMLPSNALELLSGQLPYSALQRAQDSISGPGSMNMNMNVNMSMQRGGLERSMGSLGSGGSSCISQASQWPFANDEKWELNGKNEALDSSAMRSNVRDFGGRMEAPLQPLNQLSRTQGLQRYHSAPSSFLQSLSDFNEEAFSHINLPSPLGNNNNNNEGGTDNHLNFFNENLAPILESAPSRWTKQPEPEKLVPRSNPMSSTEQYFAIQAENARQSALREPSMPSENMKSLSRSTHGPGIRSGASGAPGLRSQTLKNNLMRQSSSPAELLAAINEREDDITPTMQQQQLRSQDDGLSGVTFGNLAGKRVRFPGEMTDDSERLGDDGSHQNIRGGRTSSLTRHQSLPTTSTALDASGVDMGYDDLLDLYAPCKTRARRGYATHPRSIAERNRRSRISERMKKLQDLVPNMDKQTNTADMLDEAVEYVKHLQLQVKDLSATIVQLKNGIRQQNAG